MGYSEIKRRLQKGIFGEEKEYSGTVYAEREEKEKKYEGNIIIEAFDYNYIGEVRGDYDSLYLWVSHFDEKTHKFLPMGAIIQVDGRKVFERYDLVQIEIDLLFEEPKGKWRGFKISQGGLKTAYTGKVRFYTKEYPDGRVLYIRGSDI
jgi:hypothetical protein